MRKSREDRINSQRYITESVIALLQENPLQDITVTDVCKKAGVARVTFYKYYNSIYDVMHAAVGESVKNFLEKIGGLNPQSDAKLIIKYALMDLLSAEKMITNLIDTNMSGVLFEYINYAMEMILFEQTTNGKSMNKTQLLFIAGGIFNILVDWIKNGAKESPDSLAENIYEIHLKMDNKNI